MANRRMFSNRIANSAKFLQMPFESQLLYFHLVLRADDDGIVELYPIVRLLGMGTDNFKLLLAKDFIRELNEDQVIVITDWNEHNTIRADRKVDSIYKHLLKQTYPEIPTIEPKPRSDVKNNSQRINGGQSMDGISKVKLSKDNIISQQVGKLELKKVNQINYFIGLFEKINPSYKRLYANKTQRSALERMIKEHGEERIQEIIEKLPDIVTKPYAPKITTPIQLEKDFGKLIIFIKQNQTSNNLKRGGVYVIDDL